MDFTDSMASPKISHWQTKKGHATCSENGATILQSRSAIEKLPLDALIEIMALLFPTDIIRLRLTCKILSATSRERSIWLKILRTVCFDFGMFRPTFPTNDMTVSQLEHAATSPARFVSHLRCNLSTSVQPVYTRILSIRTNLLDSYFLVPGGRYLITSLRSGRIQLWDLGFSSHMAISPNPIASTDVENFNTIRCLGPTSDGQGIRVVIITRHATPSNFQFHVLDIYPLSLTPHFILRNSLVLAMSHIDFLVAAYLADELLLLNISSVVVVWNVVQDTWAKLEMGPRPDAQPIFIGDGNVVMLEENYIDIFQMPHLRPCQIDVDKETDRPLVTLNHTSDSRCTTLISDDCSWHTPNSIGLNSRRFDIISSMDNETCTVGHYIVVPLGNSEQHRFPRWLPLLLESTHLPSTSWIGSRTYTSAWTKPDELLFFWEQDATLMGSVLMVPTTPGVPAQKVVGSMWTFREGIETPNYAICPFAGRVVIYDTGYSEIRVMDYVP